MEEITKEILLIKIKLLLGIKNKKRTMFGEYNKKYKSSWLKNNEDIKILII